MTQLFKTENNVSVALSICTCSRLAIDALRAEQKMWLNEAAYGCPDGNKNCLRNFGPRIL